jgi:hypothetical protein
MRKIRMIEVLEGLAINAAMIGLGYLGSSAFVAAFPYALFWVA